MKIAICFHGQQRTGIKAAKSIKHFFGSWFDNADIFVHTWDVNTTRMPLNLTGYEPPVYKVTEDAHNQFKQVYRPINYYVESQEEFWTRAQNMHPPSGDLVHLWHSAFHSNQFKKTFELANNCKYDFVVRLRPDCIFPPDRKFEDDLNDVIKAPDKYHILQLFGDTYQVATSEIMDTACDFYLKGNFYGRHFWPMAAFKDYMNGQGIELQRFNDNRATILRHEFDYLDPIHYYWQINAINSMIFENINFAKEGLIYSYENLNNERWESGIKENLNYIFGEPRIPENYFKFYKDLP